MDFWFPREGVELAGDRCFVHRNRRGSGTFSRVKRSALFILAFEQSPEKVADENCQFNSALPFAASECFSAPVVDVRQLVNNDGNADVKSVYELTLKIRVGVCIFHEELVFNPFLARASRITSCPISPGTRSAFCRRTAMPWCTR